MKKILYYILLVASLALLAMGCTKEQINADVTQYTSEERKNELIQDPDVLQSISTASLAGSYNDLVAYYQSHDDFGLKAFHLATDMMCEDVDINHAHNFSFDYNLDNFGANYRRTASTWNLFYSVISGVNLILHEYFSAETDDPAVNALKAEPLALRGIMYFHLVNFYQHTYKGHENKLGVPLMLSPEDEKLPRSTVQEVYNQIIKDLTFAVEHAKATPATNTDVDRNVAAAYLAKVYAQMEDWANVEKYATIAIEGKNDSVTTPERTWAIDQSDILWGFDITGVTSTLYASFYSHVDLTLAGYAGAIGAQKIVDDKLYKSIPDTDKRKGLFLNQDFDKTLFDKYNAEGRAHYRSQVKYVQSNGFDGDYSFIRVQDPMLLRIEALIEQNKLDDATTSLTEFAKLRNPNWVAPAGQDALRDEVRWQRRVELWLEGTNWFDMKRWKMRISRGETHFTPLAMDTWDDGYLHKLPQREIDANDLLVQNP